jgi:hypothetical protein
VPADMLYADLRRRYYRSNYEQRRRIILDLK